MGPNVPSQAPAPPRFACASDCFPSARRMVLSMRATGFVWRPRTSQPGLLKSFRSPQRFHFAETASFDCSQHFLPPVVAVHRSASAVGLSLSRDALEKESPASLYFGRTSLLLCRSYRRVGAERIAASAYDVLASGGPRKGTCRVFFQPFLCGRPSARSRIHCSTD